MNTLSFSTGQSCRWLFSRLLFIFILVTAGCSSMLTNYKVRPAPVSNISDYNSYEQDFLYLVTLCEEVIPLADKYFPKEKRSLMEKEILERLGGPNATKAVFVYSISKYLAGFTNQHAYVEERSRYINGVFYPVLFHYYGNELYVSNVATIYDPDIIGQKVKAINGRPVAEVEERIGETVNADNLFSKRAMLVFWNFYSRPAFYNLSGLTDSENESLKLQFAQHMEVSIEPAEKILTWHHKEKVHPITAKSKHLYDGKTFADQNYAYFQFNACYDKTVILDGISGYVKWWIRPFVKLWLKYQFNKKDPSPLIAGYYDPERPVFKDYLATFIEDINRKKINNLIIDLRYNIGGGDLGSQLVYHLTRRHKLIGNKNFCYNPDILERYSPEKGRAFRKWYRNKFGEDPPFKKLTPIPRGKYALFSHITDPDSLYYVPRDRPVFTGRVIVLANQNTKSASALLTAFLQDNNLATVIGTTTDNNPTGPTGYTPFRLPETGLKISLPSDYIERAVPENGDVFKPDYWVENIVEDLLNGRDVVFEKALELLGIHSN
ncbi:S41 family peptidase [Thermodesulfobacteriota bacterium]